MSIPSSGDSGSRAQRPVIDTADFARASRQLSGSAGVAGMPRLASLLFDDQGAMDWTLDGQRISRPDGGHEDELHLRLSGDVGMTCTRCLGRVAVRVSAQCRYLVVADEATAERLDPDEERRDVIASSGRLEVLDLVEDEAIMVLPIVARHEHCDLPAAVSADTDAPQAAEPDAPRRNPFAALAALKRKS